MSTTEHHEYSTKLGHLRFFKNLITCLPMKHMILITLSLYSFAFSLNGAKPDNAGKPDKQKTVQNQSDAHHSDFDAVKAKDQQEEKEKKHSDDDDDDDGNDEEEATDKSNNSDKTDAIRKEAGKGSETGQQQRKEHSRKWWKFWGEEEE